MSCAGARATISAFDFVPSANVTSMPSAPETTCNAVRMSPCSVTTTPLPNPSSSSPLGVEPRRSITTTEGRTRSYAAIECGGAGVTEASAVAIALRTSRCVSGCGANSAL